MIDGGIFIGRNPSNGNELPQEAVLDWMDQLGISQAIVAHYKSIFYDFKEGNQELLDFCDKSPERFFAAPMIQPTGFDSTKDFSYLEELRGRGAQILGLYQKPSYYDISFKSQSVRDMLHMASDLGFSLQLGLESVQSLHEIADYYHDIRTPILIRWMCARGYHALAEMISVARAQTHLYFDVSSLSSIGAIQYLANAIGTERLYYSSNFPESFPLTSRFILETAEISAREKNAIAHDNLAGVLKTPYKKAEESPAMTKPFEALMKQPKIDTHWHTDGWNIIEPKKEYENFKAELDRYNIQKIIISPIRALNYEIEKGNASAFELASEDERIYALVVVDPLQSDKSIREIAKYADHPKCVGVKTIQDLYGKKLDDSAYCRIFEQAQGVGLSVMAHIPGMLEVAKKFPKLRFICAHSTYERVKHMLGQTNIYFDLATSHHDREETKLAKLIQEASEDRILFSSDAPLMSPAWTLGKLAEIYPQFQGWDKIFKKNAESAFPRLNSDFRPSISASVVSESR